MRVLFQLLAISFVWTTSLAAEQRPVVVELYTSQGCSSCPPADALFQELAGLDNVIPIALHVDYWDYIGWTDEFGHPDHATRQRAYARKAGRRTIYTPEMIINGQADIVGTKPMELSKTIMRFAEVEPACALHLSRDGGTLKINADALGPETRAIEVHMLRVIPQKEARITRGENRGETFTYTNIAKDWTVLGIWDGKSPLVLEAKVTGSEPVVVLLQEPDGGPILAASRLK